MEMKFYRTYESMRSHPPNYSDPFIVQYELPQSVQNIDQNESGRTYIVFDGIGEYLKHHCKGRYTTCHEVFLSQSYNINQDIQGHPAFDIDKKLPSNSDTYGGYNPQTLDTLLPGNWISMFQEDVIAILCKQYPSMEKQIKKCLSNTYENKQAPISSTSLGTTSNTGEEPVTDIPSISDDRDPWVWMTSPSKKKISKHLVILSIIFSKWRAQLKLLVKDLKNLNRPYSDCIDDGILRKLGSLRLPLNSKQHKYAPDNVTTSIDINPTNIGVSTPKSVTNIYNNFPQIRQIIEYSPILTFDNPMHKFTDGLVLIHEANMDTLKDSIMLTPSDLSLQYQELLMSDDIGFYKSPLISSGEESEMELVSEDKLLDAFFRMDRCYNTGLTPGTLSGKYLPLIRKSIGTCPISGRIHEGDNAYIFSKNGTIFYACHRKCTLLLNGEEKKFINITPYPAKTSESIAKAIHEKDLKDKDGDF